MRFGLFLRNMGPQSAPAALLECALEAERCEIDDLWVADHIAIPPDDAEGSGGRYLDPLATLAWLAGATQRIGLGTGVLVLPYRSHLPTAKWIASIQELSGGRLQLGVGAGWMAAEFRATGADIGRRGADTDATLAFLERCFAQDVVESNGQPFLFLPRPRRPPILVGGGSPAALRRVVRFGDGWMPQATDASGLRSTVERLQAMMAEAGRPRAQIAVLTSLPLHDAERAATIVAEFADIGATHLIHGWRYADSAAFAHAAAVLARLRETVRVHG